MSTISRPEAAAPRPYSFPRFERHEMASGLEVIVAPVRKLPMVTVALLCDAGGGSESSSEAGIAQLTARALLEGTRRTGGAELADRFERIGASVNASADWDATLVSFSVLEERFAPALELLGEVVMEPAFADRDVERLRAERLSELLQLRAEPRGLADEMFARVLYQQSSRYALPQDGGATTVSNLSADDLRRFHGERFRPGSSAVVIVGDVDVDGAISAIDRVFGRWSGGAAATTAVADLPARTTRASHLVAKEGAAQSELRLGHVGLPRAHPDYFPVLVMNALLGGLFSSRINLNLRERNGFTYGAFSSFDWRRAAGPFVVATAVASDVTAAAAREVLAEVELMREAPVSEEELALATSYLAGVFPIRYETTGAIARALAAMRIYGLSEEYFDSYRERVLQLAPADVLRAAREHLHPESLQLLVVGDPAQVTPQVAELGVGPLSTYDADMDSVPAVAVAGDPGDA